MNIGERIKARRLHVGLTQTELGDKVALSQSALQNIESGKTRSPRNIGSIAIALITTPEYLQFGILVGSESNVNECRLPVLKNNLPLIDWVQAGAWTHKLKEFDMKFFQCPVDCSENSFVLEVKGISMEPLFKEGDHIFIDPDANYRNKDYVVAVLGESEQVTFKQLIIEDNKKYLKSVNPDWLEKFIEINDNCKIIGKLIYKGEVF